MNLKRRVFCDILGWHIGTPETTRVDAGEAEYALTYIRCPRCGDVSALHLQPWHNVEKITDTAPRREHR